MRHLRENLLVKFSKAITSIRLGSSENGIKGWISANLSGLSENRITGWIGASLTRKVGAGLVAMAVLLLLTIGAIFVRVQQQRSDANVINVASQQRIFSQQIANYTQRAIHGEAQAIDELQAAADQFDRSLKGLQNGDPALDLPPAPPSVRPQLDAIDKMWQQDYQNVQIVLEAAAAGGEVQELTLSLGERSEALLAASRETVTALEDADAATSAVSFAQQLPISAERIVELVSQIGQGQIDVAPQLAAESKRFREILYVLLLGIDRAGGPAKEQLLDLKAVWEPFSTNVQALLAAAERGLEARDAVVASSEPLLRATDTAVRLFQREAEGKVGWMQGFLAGVAAVFMLVFGVVLWNTRAAIRPVARVAEATTAIAKGDLSTRVDVASKDEIGALAAAFNQMTEDLQRTTVSRDYVDKILASMDEALIVVTPDAIIQTVNQATTDLLGYAEEELIGQPIGTILAEQEPLPEGRGLEELMREGSIGSVESAYRAKDGRKIAVLFSGAAMQDEAGEVQGIVCVARDITERKRAEAELREAKEAAEAASRAKSEFLANMSHEVRTPLNAVIGMTGLLLDTRLTPEQQDFVETIRSSGDALLSIINDILDFSKIEAGKLELENQPFNLRDCVEESLDLLAPEAAEKQLNLAYLIDAQVPPTVVGDVTRLRQVLVNLLSNAVKFTDRGEVVVRVTCCLLGDKSESVKHATPNPQYELHFAVRDTGIGIPEDRMDRLFQSFSQVDASTTRHYGGTGLGLAIGRRLAEMMGGTMWVESELDKGSTFHFTIVAEAVPSEPQPFLRSAQPQLANRRVLIVDDNATNRRILIGQTESWGMVPRATGSGAEALAWIRQGEPFDVAILDMQMPEMDGLTLAAEIRKYRDPQELPLAMLTSVAWREAGSQAVQFAAHLTKPIKPSQLHDVLVGIFAGQPIRVREADLQPQIDPEMGQRHPLHILLAEDNVVNQKVTLRILKRMGYRADVAANGLEVLEALERQPYDVVLMDVQMPEMGGQEATRRIREQWPAERQPRIIAMTAHALRGDRERYLAVGMDDYVSKPVRVEELVAALERCQPLNADFSESSRGGLPVRGTQTGSHAAGSSGVGARPATGEPRSEPGADGHGAETSVHASPTSDVKSPIDRQILAQMTEMMGEDAPQVMADLIDTFLDSTPRLLADLRQAVRAGDADALQRIAHTLKSSTASVGAVTVSELCKELEALSRARTLDGAAEKVTQIEAEYERVKTALETMHG